VFVRFRRVPARSCRVRVALTDLSGGARTPLRDAYIYGRGAGSEAREQVNVIAPLDPAVIANRKAEQDTLSLEILELDGKPVTEPAFLELLDHEARPRT